MESRGGSSEVFPDWPVLFRLKSESVPLFSKIWATKLIVLGVTGAAASESGPFAHLEDFKGKVRLSLGFSIFSQLEKWKFLGPLFFLSVEFGTFFFAAQRGTPLGSPLADKKLGLKRHRS